MEYLFSLLVFSGLVIMSSIVFLNDVPVSPKAYRYSRYINIYLSEESLDDEFGVLCSLHRITGNITSRDDKALRKFLNKSIYVWSTSSFDLNMTWGTLRQSWFLKRYYLEVGNGTRKAK